MLSFFLFIINMKDMFFLNGKRLEGSATSASRFK